MPNCNEGRQTDTPENDDELRSIGGLQSETGEFIRKKINNKINRKGQAREMCAIKMGNYTFLKTAMRGPD